MLFRHSLLFAISFGLSAAFADDGFDLPDDVQKAEVKKADATEDPEPDAANFAPIEATTTNAPDFQPDAQVEKAIPGQAGKDSVQGTPPQAAKATKQSANKDSVPNTNIQPAKEIPASMGITAAEKALDDKKVEAETTAAEDIRVDEDTPAAFKVREIPEKLDRPLRVGIFTGVKELYLLYQGETVHVTPRGNKVRFEAGSNSTEDISHEFNSEDGGCLSVAPDKKSLGKACYPGSVMFRSVNGKLDAINSVDVEDYLRGVVPYEIGKLDSGRIEALKAQAVAARTYAYKHFNSRETLGFDVYADTKDQVYKGLASATPLTDAAVKATAGVVMTYNGEFIIAYYHSTCGGVTETLATWNRKGLPYLQSKPDRRPNGKPWCDESSYIKWERRFADKEIVKLFKSNVSEAKANFSTPKGSDFSTVKSIEIKDKLKSGRILTLRVETDKGHFDVLTDRTRWLFKKAGTILPSSFFSIRKDGKEWVLTGTGFGHGVGMCQMGVRARAQAGQSYQEILSHYYPGITLEQFER